MKRFIHLFGAFALVVFLSCQKDKGLHSGFVDLKQMIPNLELDLRYKGNHNFVGRPIRGYEANKLFISREAAEALVKVQQELSKGGLGIKAFDAYRPQRAVQNFMEWALDIQDTVAKQEFYPDVDKRDLFKLGYIAEKSGHTRGSTIDLTIIDLVTKEEIDMGSAFDFFGIQSHHDYTQLSAEQIANRQKLRNIMEKYGFKTIEEEWWHYTLKNEPFPDTYFDFLIR
ncbi:MAG: M15 family metallopeptidase [Chitinophagales bacterium]|nr:M15 family metallopeptidase [Chitinophagales bacterium]